MIKVKKVATRKIEICWEKGKEYQFLLLLQKLIEERNWLEQKRMEEKQ